MANIIRIIPESGSITFARNASSISGSLSGIPQTELNITSGTLAVKNNGTNVVEFTPSEIDFPNSSILKIP